MSSTKFCHKCKKHLCQSEFYKTKKNASYCKECMKSQVLERQRELKKQCVLYKGGKCEVCNYNKCPGALEFHHKDPTQKDFNLAVVRRTKLDQSIISEIDKCILVCANCHREIHYKGNKIKIPKKSKSNTVFIFDKRKTNKGRKKKKKLNLLRPHLRKVKRPSYKQLMKEIKETNYLQVGKKYGVSNVAIKKWVKMYEKYEK